MQNYSFKDTLGHRTAWSEISWQHNTGRGYQHKQDLIAVFTNAFRYYEDKVTTFWEQRKELDEQTINDLIYDFRLHFAPSGRVEGIQYFDDLLLMLIQKFKAKLSDLPAPAILSKTDSGMVRYYLDRFFKQSYESKYFRGEIEADGYCLPIGPKYRVYSGALAALLSADEVDVEIDTRQVIVIPTVLERTDPPIMHNITVESGEIKPGVIHGKDFAELYRVGYDKGKIWFEKNYGSDCLKGENAKSYVADLHHLLCHSPHYVIVWKGAMPQPVNKSTIAEIAYYSGILAEIDSLQQLHPYIISDLVECRHKQEKPAPATSAPPPASNGPRADRPAITPGFDTYIVEGHRAKLITYLTENYTGKMPREIVPMVYALDGLNCLTLKVANSEGADIISTLQTSFGAQLKDSALKDALQKYDPESMQPDLAKQQKIAQHRQAIERILKPS